MKQIQAVVYTSNTGFTARYAAMLGEKTGLPVYPLTNAKEKLEKGMPILYMGWLFGSNVKGYSQASKRYKIIAVCGVGLCDTGALLEEVRKTISLPQSIPLFTLQGGMDRSKLRGFNRWVINTLTNALSKQKDLAPEKQRMLELLQTDGDYVSAENLERVVQWYQQA